MPSNVVVVRTSLKLKCRWRGMLDYLGVDASRAPRRSISAFQCGVQEGLKYGLVIRMDRAGDL